MSWLRTPAVVVLATWSVLPSVAVGDGGEHEPFVPPPTEGPGPCAPDNCPDGCCEGDICVVWSAITCGGAGQACVNCKADGLADSCVDGACECIATGSLCEPDQFCAKPAGDCDGEGTCAIRPEVCTQQWDPVCGCDEETYGNACEAAASGQNVASAGECNKGG